MRLVAALGTGLLVAACSGPPQALPPAAADAPLRAVSPAGEVTWPFEFRWAGAEASTVVRVRVYDAAERHLYGLETRGSRIRAPGGLKSILRPGTRYRWNVARVDENGEESGASKLEAFELRP